MPPTVPQNTWNWSARYGVPSENKRLLELAMQKPYEGIGRDAGRILLSQGGAPLVWATLKGKEASKASATLAALRSVGSKESLDILSTMALDAKQPLAVRREAVRSLGGSQNGEDMVLAY